MCVQEYISQSTLVALEIQLASFPDSFPHSVLGMRLDFPLELLAISWRKTINTESCMFAFHQHVGTGFDLEVHMYNSCEKLLGTKILYAVDA